MLVSLAVAPAAGMALVAVVVVVVAVLAWRVGPPAERWSLAKAFGALAVLVGAAAAGVVLFSLVGGVELGAEPPPLEAGLLGTVFGGLCATALVLRFAESRALGLHLELRPRHWGEAAAGMLGFLVLSTAWSLGLEAAGVEVEAQQVLGELLGAAPAVQVLIVLYAVVGAPVIEELLFRGALVPPLARRLGPALAAVVSGLLFGLAHASDPVAVLPLTVLGVGLALLRLRTGSVVPGLAVHVVNNLIAVLSFAALSA